MITLDQGVLRIVCDVDEVFSEQVSSIHEAARKAEPKLGRAAELEFKSYWHLNYSELWKVEPPVAHEFVIDYLSRRSLDLPLVSGGYNSLRRIERVAEQHGVEAQFYALTSRSSRLEEATRLQLHHHFPDIFEDNRIFVTGNPEPEPPQYSKAHYYRQIGGHVIIDDGIKNVEECVREAGGLGIVFGNYPWNRGKLRVPGVYRCGNWGATERLILQTFFPDAA